MGRTKPGPAWLEGKEGPELAAEASFVGMTQLIIEDTDPLPQEQFMPHDPRQWKHISRSTGGPKSKITAF